MLENTIKGWVLSAIGLLGLVAVIAHATGFYELPNPDILSKTYECVIAGIFCFALFLLPKTKIDTAIEKLFTWAIDKFTK